MSTFGICPVFLNRLLKRVTGGILMALLALVTGTGLVSAAGEHQAADAEMSVLERARLQATQERMRDIGYWQDKVANSPEDVTIRLALANAYTLNHQYRRAIREYKQVVNLYPDYVAAWSNLGSANRALGQNSEALSAYRKVLEIQPSHALAHYNIGAVYDAAGNYDQAIKYYALAFRLDPRMTELRHNPQVATNNWVFAATLSNYVKAEGGIAIPLEPAYPNGRPGR